MGITQIPDSGLRVPSSLSLIAAAGTGLTVDAGHGYVNSVNYSGAAVSTNIQDVADITAPSSWTDIVDLSGSKMLINIDLVAGTGIIVQITIDENEDAGEDIRAQVIVDELVVADITVTRDVASVTNSVFGSSNVGNVIECENSFKIRGCCEGNNFADAGTVFKTGAVTYQKIK